uniref:ATP-binding cassette domain-containing protein n=3 Tax=unclassified Prevotella TaxID=2638335 RepID=A0AB33JH86_9BACT
MERIKFSHVLPQVFSNRDDVSSEIWQQDLEFQKGHLYLLESESGKGKSTFCSYIMGYRHDYSGDICFDEQQVREFGIGEWVEQRRRHISHLFQELRLFPELTAYENVAIKNQMTAFKTDVEIRECFDRLGIADKMNTKIGFMSFGQQQRVAFIRSLVQPFDFLLADEPISHLDDNNAAIMADMMQEEAKKQGAGIIVTSIGKHMDMNYERILKL